MVAQGQGGTSYSVPVQTLLFFTALSFLPAVLLVAAAHLALGLVVAVAIL